MTNELNILTADFPRAVRGYSTIAVDDFVRQLGGRLEAIQVKLNEQSDRAASLESLLNQSHRDLAAFVEKESAISKGIIGIEQRRVVVEHEIELARQNAEIEIAELLAASQNEAENVLRTARETSNEIVAGARQTADETVDAARNAAEESTTLARSATELQGDRLRALCAEYDEAAARIRRSLEAQLALLPLSGSLLQNLSISGVAITTSVDQGVREHAEAA